MSRSNFSSNNLLYYWYSLSDYRKTTTQSLQPSLIRTFDEGGKQDVGFTKHVL